MHKEEEEEEEEAVSAVYIIGHVLFIGIENVVVRNRISKIGSIDQM